MEKTLNTDGIIDSLTDNTKGLAKALKDVSDKIKGANGAAVDIPKAEYEAVGTAVDTIKESIDKTLEAGGLTQLDTSNLKAIRTAVLDLGKTFSSIEEFKPDAQTVTKYTVGKDDLDKVSKALENISKSREEAGASATKALSSSKAQAENIGEMITLRVILWWLYFRYIKQYQKCFEKLILGCRD